MINIYDSMTMAIVCIYYSKIDHSWFWLSLTMFLLSLVATVTILICPESPRWHLVNGRGEEAIEALNQIAQLNGKGEKLHIPEDAIFEEDPTNFHLTVDTKTGQAHQALFSKTVVPNDEDDFFGHLDLIEEQNEDDEDLYGTNP